MQSRLARLLVVLAAVQILGGHWAVLQSVAWVGMVAKYVQVESLPAAIEKTFGGANPCDLCKVVIQGRSADESQPVAKDMAKLKVEAVIVPIAALPLPPAAPRHFFTAATFPRDVFFTAPTPPPRRA